MGRLRERDCGKATLTEKCCQGYTQGLGESTGIQSIDRVLWKAQGLE